MGGMDSFQTRIPFTAPIIAPSASAMTMMTGMGKPGMATLIMATAMPVRARLAATDKSMQRVRITTICPNASMINGAVSLNTLARFPGATKPEKREATSMSKTRIAVARMVSRTGISRIMLLFLRERT